MPKAYCVTGLERPVWVSSEVKARQMIKDKGQGTVTPFDIPTRLSDLLDFLNTLDLTNPVASDKLPVDRGQQKVDTASWPDDIIDLQKRVIERLQGQLNLFQSHEPKKGK